MKKSTKFLLISIFLISIFFSCNKSDKVSLSLTDKGIPVTITVPEDYEISDGIGNADFEGVQYMNFVVKKDKFILDIFMPKESPTGKLEDYLKRAKEQAKQENGFAEFVLEEKAGFIYKIKTSEGFDYNFNYTIIKENRAIEFVAGLNFSDYTLPEIKKIYEAAKTAK